MAALGSLLLDSLSMTSWLIVALVGLVSFLFYQRRRPPAFPPGPPSLPLLGSIPFLTYKGDNLHLEFRKLGQKYGSIFSVSFGHTWVVVLNDFDAMKEALVVKGTDFAGRPMDPRFDLAHWTPPIRGIIDGDYSPEWARQRHNAMAILREFGFGKHSIENKMKEEREIMIKVLREKGDKPFDPARLINICVANIICSLLFGETFDHEDEQLGKITRHIETSIQITAVGAALDHIPIIRHLIPGQKFYIDRFKAGSDGLNSFIAGHIKERSKGLVNGHINDPKDFIERYLNEIEAMKAGKPSKISQDWLRDIGNDMFIAGSETTTTTLKWALIYMLHYPEVQHRVHEELDEVFGKPGESTMSSLVDRERLPYTDATIMEVQRLAAIVAMALTHKTIKDVEIRGYRIPKDMQVRYNLYNALRDPKYWKDAETFKPERFIGEDGKIVKNEHWIPFGMGRRNCLGEQLARQELFMFFTAIMHAFTVKLPEGEPLPSLEPEYKGIILIPHRFKAIFEPRV